MYAGSLECQKTGLLQASGKKKILQWLWLPALQSLMYKWAKRHLSTRGAYNFENQIQHLQKNSPLRKVPTIHEYSWKHWSITINLMIWPIWVIATVVLELARCPAQLFSIWCSPYNGQPLKGAQFVQSIVQWALIRSKEDALLWRCNKRPLQLTEVKRMTDHLSSESGYTIVRNNFTTSVCIHTKRTY